jgi:3',5'-cyclic AMP phosphodiesterase CpdA
MGKIILAQISDLHFDENILNDRFNRVPGREGHDKVLAFGLMPALEGIPIDCQTTEPLHVVVSGDLTRTGEASEFAVAHTLLLSTVRLNLLPPPDLLGYGTPEDRFMSVPGNHDQYGAGPMAAFNPTLSGVHFDATPWHRRIRDSTGELTLDLFGIDSNSGRIPAPPGLNLLAWGQVADLELNSLENLLRRTPHAPTGQTIRALVMHHSLSYFGGVPGALLWMGALLSRSKRRLRHMCATYGISAVLTGHTHDLFCKELVSNSGGGVPHVFWELRSPSTLIGPVYNHVHGFLVHELQIGRTDE